MVSLVRQGTAMRSVARRFKVGLATVQLWVGRAEAQRLDRVDWADRPAGPRAPQRLSRPIEDQILGLRRELKETSDLGEFGAAAIRAEMLRQGFQEVPALRTIGRVLERRGALDGRRRVRRAAPPAGWYLPPLAAREAELDSFDMVEGLVIAGGPHVEILNGISLHGALPAAWPTRAVTAKMAVKSLIEHWRAVGLPAFAQFDNDTRFQGPHHFPDVFGRLTRLCLSLNVVPVFAPPRETGFQASIESFNGRWQAKVWARFQHASLKALRQRSARYVQACRRRAAARIEAAPPRRPFPAHWRLNLQAPLRGRVIFLRRTDAAGKVGLLGHDLPVDPLWPHRLVRCEVDLDRRVIRFYALRRREPTAQPLLKQIDYDPPKKRFQE